METSTIPPPHRCLSISIVTKQWCTKTDEECGARVGVLYYNTNPDLDVNQAPFEATQAWTNHLWAFSELFLCSSDPWCWIPKVQLGKLINSHICCISCMCETHIWRNGTFVWLLYYIGNRRMLICPIKGCFDCNMWNLLYISWPLLVFIPSNKKEMLSLLPGSSFPGTPILPGHPTSTRSIALFIYSNLLPS